MLFRIPGRDEPVYGYLEAILVPIRGKGKGGGSREAVALWIEGLPWGTRETAGWELVSASEAEGAALFRAGYVIPRCEEVSAMIRRLARVGGGMGRGEAKRRPADHYSRMLAKRRELGMIKVNNHERRRLAQMRREEEKP